MEYRGCMGMSNGGEVFEGWRVIIRSFIEILFLVAPSLLPPDMIEVSSSISSISIHAIDDVVAKVREEFASTSNPEDDAFFDLRDLMSTVSNVSCGNEQLWKPSTLIGEFLDVFDEIASDYMPKSFSGHVEDELREMKVNVLMEIERRKQASRRDS